MQSILSTLTNFCKLEDHNSRRFNRLKNSLQLERPFPVVDILDIAFSGSRVICLPTVQSVREQVVFRRGYLLVVVDLDGMIDAWKDSWMDGMMDG